MRHVILVTCVLGSIGCAAQRPGDAIMTFDEYADVSHVLPYVLDLDTGTGRLVLFGARHSVDPDDPQVSWIESLWDQTAPTTALNEGGDPPVEASRREAVRRHGEAGLVRFLGARDGVPVMSLEPTPADESSHLCGRFDPPLVTLFYVLRSYDWYRRVHGRDGADAFARDVLDWAVTLPCLRHGPRTVEELTGVYHAAFPEAVEWRGFPSSMLDPVRRDQPWTVCNEISRAASEFRDRHMVDLLVELVERGERVFAVVGGSHVVMQEPALRARIRR